MNVLVVGGGGREHALAWRLAQDPEVTRVLCAPGNPGIAAVAQCLPVDATDVESGERRQFRLDRIERAEVS